MTALVAGAFGLVIGSYLNVLIARYGTARRANQGRSICPACKHQLSAADLVPVVSFAMLGGRCRYCHTAISWRYPLIEATSAIGTAVIATQLPLGLALVGVFLAFWISIVIIAIDIDQFLIPDRAVIALVVAGLFWRLSGPADGRALVVGLVGALATAGVLALLVLITRGRGMGLGDVKLQAAIGFFLGTQLAIIGLFTAFIVGALVGVMFLLNRSRTWGDALPFAPFLLLGAGIAMIWGEQLYRWFIGL